MEEKSDPQFHFKFRQFKTITYKVYPIIIKKKVGTYKHKAEK